MSEPPLLLRVDAAASRMGVSSRRLYELAARPGELPEGLVIRLGRSVFFSNSRLEQWLCAGAGSANGNGTMGKERDS